MITHNLGVVAESRRRRRHVRRQGRRGGIVDEIFTRPRHPYTWGLLVRCLLDTTRPARPDPGLAAVAAEAAERLPLPSALSLLLDVCNSVVPELLAVSNSPQHLQACHLDGRRRSRGGERSRGPSRRRPDGRGRGCARRRGAVKHFPVTRGIVFQKQVASIRQSTGSPSQ